MTHHDDHWPAMTRHPSQLRRRRADRDLDLLGDGGTPAGTDLQEVAAYLTTLHTLVELPAPRPSPELAAVLTHGLVPTAPAPSSARLIQHPARSRLLRRRALAVGLSAGIAASLAGGAAASDRLPDSAQNVWERLVEAVTPFAVHDPIRPDTAGTDPGARGHRASASPDPEQGLGVTTTPPLVQDEGPDQPTVRRSAETSATDPDKTVRDSKETVEGSVDDSSTTDDPGDDDTESSGAADADADGDAAQTDKTTQGAGHEEPAAEGDSEPETSVLPYPETRPSQTEPDSTEPH